jgi:hypothetical protein
VGGDVGKPHSNAPEGDALRIDEALVIFLREFPLPASAGAADLLLATFCSSGHVAAIAYRCPARMLT